MVSTPVAARRPEESQAHIVPDGIENEGSAQRPPNLDGETVGHEGDRTAQRPPDEYKLDRVVIFGYLLILLILLWILIQNERMWSVSKLVAMCQLEHRKQIILPVIN